MFVYRMGLGGTFGSEQEAIKEARTQAAWDHAYGDEPMEILSTDPNTGTLGVVKGGEGEVYLRTYTAAIDFQETVKHEGENRFRPYLTVQCLTGDEIRAIATAAGILS